MKTETTPPDKCPYCGAETIELIIKVKIIIYECGVWGATIEDRTELCLERESRKKAEAELSDSKELVWKYQELVEECLNVIVISDSYLDCKHIEEQFNKLKL